MVNSKSRSNGLEPFGGGRLVQGSVIESPRTRRRFTVAACIDARIDVADLPGLQTGDAHIIRNAGGVVTDDAIRCLIIPHHLLNHPWIPTSGPDAVTVRGFTYHVDTGKLDEVSCRCAMGSIG